MRPPILFLEQQSTRAGAQRVLNEVLRAIEPEFEPLLAFPEDGPYAQELRDRGIETLIYPLGRYRSGPKSLADMVTFPFHSLQCALKLRDVVRRRNVGLVYINGPRTLVAGVLAARLTGRPSLFHLHMTLTRRADTLLAANIARYATRIVAVSQTTAAALVRNDALLAAKTQVVYNPVPKPVPKPGAGRPPASRDQPRGDARGAEAIIGLVGRVTPGKGHHVLLEAAALLFQRGLNFRLVLVGAPDPGSVEDAAYLEQLKQSARRLGIESRVEWTGYQADPDPYYATFDVLVMPSIVREGLGMVALEAMQWGVPVVGSRLGGILEIVRDGDNGLLFTPGDPSSLAQSLERVLADQADRAEPANRGLRARLEAGARVSVDDRFSVQTFRSKIRHILLELCPVPDASAAAQV